jgi:hypothetical protein
MARWVVAAAHGQNQSNIAMHEFLTISFKEGGSVCTQ